MSSVNIFGYVAQFLFIFASLAQARKSYVEGHSEGISHGLIWSLIVGFVCMMYYVISKIGFDFVLMSGYIGQLTFCLVIAKYKYFPRKSVVSLPRGLTQEQIEAAALATMTTNVNAGMPEELWVWSEEKGQFINAKAKD